MDLSLYCAEVSDRCSYFPSSFFKVALVQASIWNSFYSALQELFLAEFSRTIIDWCFFYSSVPRDMNQVFNSKSLYPAQLFLCQDWDTVSQSYFMLYQIFTRSGRESRYLWGYYSGLNGPYMLLASLKNQIVLSFWAMRVWSLQLLKRERNFWARICVYHLLKVFSESSTTTDWDICINSFFLSHREISLAALSWIPLCLSIISSCICLLSVIWFFLRPRHNLQTYFSFSKDISSCFSSRRALSFFLLASSLSQFIRANSNWLSVDCLDMRLDITPLSQSIKSHRALLIETPSLRLYTFASRIQCWPAMLPRLPFRSVIFCWYLKISPFRAAILVVQSLYWTLRELRSSATSWFSSYLPSLIFFSIKLSIICCFLNSLRSELDMREEQLVLRLGTDLTDPLMELSSLSSNAIFLNLSSLPEGYL